MPSLRRFIAIVREIERYRVNAVAFISWCAETLSFEYVTKVTSAGVANDLCANHAKGYVLVTTYSARDSIEESRPATSTIKLRGTGVQRGSTPSAFVNSLALEFLVLSGAGRFGALLTQDAELLLSEYSLPFAIALGVGRHSC